MVLIKRFKESMKKGLAFFCRLLPLQNKVVLSNFEGRGFGDDEKYIALEILKVYPNIRLVWFVRNMHEPLPVGIKPVKYGSFMAVYELSTAKVWVDNIKSSFRVPKRKGQFYIQTWHSTLGFKMNEADAPSLWNWYVEKAKKDAAITDLMYSNNDFRIEKYRKRYWYNGLVIKCDIPRVSILINTPKELRSTVYQYFNISKEKKIVLYAPTFRKSDNLDNFIFDYELVIKTLEKKFCGKFVMLLRLHPNFAILQNGLKYSSNVIPASSYPDIQELLAVSDVLISDFSGCMFDFSIPKKPVFLIAKDYHEYIKKDRKLYFKLEELPFSMALSCEELCKNIQSFDYIEYQAKCTSFLDSIGLVDTGHGAEYIANIISQYINKNKYDS